MMEKLTQGLAYFLFILMFAISVTSDAAQYHRMAKDTITPIELDIGDEFHFRLHNGETRVLKLLDSGAGILLTNVYPEVKRQERSDHGIFYQIWIDVEIDGEVMRMTHYLCSQFSFYEPYYVNGMRIWFEYNRSPVEFMTSNRGGYPEKEVRIVVNDMTDRIAPDTFTAWYRLSEEIEAKEFLNERIDARDCYKGDDMHMGGYFGATPHNGLDINMPKGTQMLAPIDFDDHFIVSNMNRWRGVRKWDNGSEWWLQSHHLFRTVIPVYTSLSQGIQYGEGAGLATGDAEHSHFAFLVHENGERYTVDAWLIFWQTFRDRQDARGDIRASMGPVSPVKAGEKVDFSSGRSRSGTGKELLYSWSFGDGAASTEANPSHIYAKPGMYAVRLTIDDGDRLAHMVQNITVKGDEIPDPVAALSAADEVEFLSWPVNATLLHAEDPKFMTHTLRFTARPSRPKPVSGVVHIINNGKGVLDTAAVNIKYLNGNGWCAVDKGGKGNEQWISVSADATGLEPGKYLAEIEVSETGALNGVQQFRVQLTVEEKEPASGELIMLNDEPGFFATPWFWAPHSFSVNYGVDLYTNTGRWDRPMLPPALLTKDGKNRMGLSERYLSNGYRKEEGQFFRFTPDLAAGTYIISTPADTPWDSTSEVNVRIRHAGGDTMVRYKPGVDPVLGTFEFNEGRDGFVEFYAEGSTGQVTADALVFTDVDYVPIPEAEDSQVSDIDGLVAHWSFDDYDGEEIQLSARDSINGHVLKFHNMPGDERTWTAGKSGGYALKLDGADDYAVAGAIGLEPGQTRTLSAWIRLESEEQPSNSTILGFEGEEKETSFGLGFPVFGKRTVIDINNRSWTIQAVRDKQWHHFTIVWDGGNIFGYRDGEQIIRAASPLGMQINDFFRICGKDGFFNGEIDEVRVYDRDLDMDEVKKLFAGSLEASR